jgi:hypothetical protein
VKRLLRELRRGDVFRTADGRLWRVGDVPVPDVGTFCNGVCRDDHGRDFRPDAPVEPLDLPALLARLAALEKENRDLRGMVADLWDGSGAARLGAEAERGAVLGLFRTYLEGSGVHCRKLVREWQEAVEARGPWRPPVPPCALEGVVRETVEVLGPHYDEGPGWTSPHVQVVRGLLARLRAAVEPDGPVGRLDRSLGEG